MEYRIDDLIDINKINPKRTLFLQDILDYPFILSENKILTMPLRLTEKERIIVVDSSGNILSKFGKFPQCKNKEEDYGLSNIFESQFATNEDESEIAIFNKYTDLIEIYTVEGNLLYLKQGPDCFLSEYKIVRNEEINAIWRVKGKTREGYYGPVAKDGILWALYCGMPLNDEENEVNRILTFDWEGNPLTIYEMQHNIISFDVDNKNRVIYGLTLADSKYSIFAYKY